MEGREGLSQVNEQRNALTSLLEEALQLARKEGKLPFVEGFSVQLETPKDKQHGDFATNLAMVLAKPCKMAPRAIAEVIVHYLSENPLLETVEIKGPGFINFHLSKRWLFPIVERVLEQGIHYGNCNYGKEHRILLEFVSANPVGPMNVVNARAAAVGDSLARLYKAVGYHVEKEYYVNDAGNQADIFGRSLEARYLQLSGKEVLFPEEGYPAQYVMELAKELKEEYPDLLAMTQEERRSLCKRWGTDKMVEQQQRDLKRYGVEFDTWFRERDLHAAGSLEAVIGELQDKGHMYEKEDALWFRSTTFGDDKDRVIRKSDGTYTYVTADFAYHYDKYKRGFDTLLDILGPDHHGYIGRMQAGMQALGYKKESFQVLILQYVTLLRDGVTVKMSKRAGEFITMQDLLEEVGKDAARYFFLNRSPESHLDFDLSLAVEQGSENPVFYVQYAHARIASILRQAEELGISLPEGTELSFLDNLKEEAEFVLIRKLGDFPEEVLQAAINKEPHRIARFSLELASCFHSFYTYCHVLGEQPEVRTARLLLVSATKQVLFRALDLLGVSAPLKM